jgi:antitoxin component YwqK of YwqJK toxin-antitoxin module
MKNVLLIFVFSINYSFSQWVFDNIPEPKLQENGKCVEYYELNVDNYKYIENSNIIDWLNSSRKIFSSEPIKKNHFYLVYKYKNKESIKQGKFSIQLSVATALSSGSLTLTPQSEVVNGEYVSGKLNGVVFVATYDFAINLTYSDGVIANQQINFKQQIINLKDQKIEIYPKIIFSNGRVVESIFNDKDVLSYYVEKGQNSISLKYTNNHISSIAGYYNDKLLECTYFKRSDNNDLVIQGFKNYEVTNILFDTTKIIASYTALNNKLNGEAKIWSKKNNKLNHPMLIINYKDNLIDGEYVSYFDDGRIKEKYTYKDGFLNGKAELYVSKTDNYDFLLPKEEQAGKIKYYDSEISYNNLNVKNAQDLIFLLKVKSKSLIVPVSLIMAHIGKNHDKKFDDKYYDVTQLDYFKYCDLEFKYNEEKKKSCLNNYDISVGENKFMEINPQNCNDCFKVFDKNQNVILSTEIMKEFKMKSDKQAEIEYQNLLKKEIPCKWCDKKIVLKDAYKTDECNCIKNNNEPTRIFLSKFQFYCSRKCASDHEKQICRDNGYR